MEGGKYRHLAILWLGWILFAEMLCVRGFEEEEEECRGEIAYWHCSRVSSIVTLAWAVGGVLGWYGRGRV